MQNEIHWYCDECGDYLNYQPKFNTKSGRWDCLKCNYNNDVSSNNVDWTCDNCNITLNTQDGFNTDNGTWNCLECGFENNITQNFPCEVCGDMMNEQEGFFAKVNSWDCNKCGTNYGPEKEYGLGSVYINEDFIEPYYDLTLTNNFLTNDDLVGYSKESLRSGANYLSKVIISNAELISKESREIYNQRIKPYLIKQNFIDSKLSNPNLDEEYEMKLLLELDSIAINIKEITIEYESKQKKSFIRKIFGIGVKITGEVGSILLPYLIERSNEKKKNNDEID